jgi:hypothetical protein
VDDVLREVARGFELLEESVGFVAEAGQLGFGEGSLAGEDAVDFLGEELVAGFFAVEEFGAAGGVVDDFGDLGNKLA